MTPRVSAGAARSCHGSVSARRPSFSRKISSATQGAQAVATIAPRSFATTGQPADRYCKPSRSLLDASLKGRASRRATLRKLPVPREGNRNARRALVDVRQTGKPPHAVSRRRDRTRRWLYYWLNQHNPYEPGSTVRCPSSRAGSTKVPLRATAQQNPPSWAHFLTSNRNSTIRSLICRIAANRKVGLRILRGKSGFPLPSVTEPICTIISSSSPAS